MPLTWVSNNPILSVIGLMAFGATAYWYFDERQDSDGARDTMERVGQRAEVVTGGLVGWFGSLLTVLAAIAVTIGNELLQTGGVLNELLGGAPILVGHFMFGLLTFAGLAGIIPITPEQLGFAFVLLTVVGLIVRYGGVNDD